MSHNYGSLGGIPRGVPPQRLQMRALWKAQALICRIRKARVGPQVAVAFEMGILSAAQVYAVDFGAVDKTL